MNPFDIIKPCIKIENSEVIFEKNRMALNPEKYDIEVQDDDAIKRNQILFDFMQRTFSCMNGLYIDEEYPLIYTNKKISIKEQECSGSGNAELILKAQRQK